MKNIAVIYHDADYDGKLSNEVCRYHLKRLYPKAAIHSYGWDYGRATPIPNQLTPPLYAYEGWMEYDAVYIVDLSVDKLMARPELKEKIIWIDHHKSAIEKWDKGEAVDGECHPDNPIATRPMFKGYRIDGVAACRLCWQWFVKPFADMGVLPSKQDYINRAVTEPELIRLAGEYDVWDHRDPDAKALQFGLRTLTKVEFENLFLDEFSMADHGTDKLYTTINQGHAIKSYCDKQNDEYSKAHSHTIHWEGLTFCALNVGQRGNSDLLLGGIKPEHDACFSWRWTGQKVLVSLYHIKGKEHHDLSLIATRYGGGGHKGACGFQISLSELEKILT